jgi:hypothetical protein
MKIIGNGSKWYGSDEDPIEKLFEVLSTHTLDPRSARNDGFYFEPQCLNPDVQTPPGTFHVSGNFFDISHGFLIEGTDKELEPLKQAIEANMATPAYAEAVALIAESRRIKHERDFGKHK